MLLKLPDWTIHTFLSLKIHRSKLYLEFTVPRIVDSVNFETRSVRRFAFLGSFEYVYDYYKFSRNLRFRFLALYTFLAGYEFYQAYTIYAWSDIYHLKPQYIRILTIFIHCRNANWRLWFLKLWNFRLELGKQCMQYVFVPESCELFFFLFSLSHTSVKVDFHVFCNSWFSGSKALKKEISEYMYIRAPDKIIVKYIFGKRAGKIFFPFLLYSTVFPCSKSLFYFYCLTQLKTN